MNAQVRDLTVQVCSTIASDEFKIKIAQALPEGITPERFVRVALTAIQQNPKLCSADRSTLYSSVIRCAQDGLLPDGREAALVIYNTKINGEWVDAVQYQPMVTGIIKRFGEVGIHAYAASVHQLELDQDRFKLWNDDTGQHVEHQPIVFGERGEFVGVYAVARTPDGRTYVEALNLTEIDRIAASSKSKDRQTGEPVGPWKVWKDRMAQKSGLHRLGRRVPVTRNDAAGERLASVLQAEGELYERTTGTEPALPAPQAAQDAPAGPRRPRGLDAVAAAAQPQPDSQAIDGEYRAIDEPDGPPPDDRRDPEAGVEAAHF